MGSYYSSPEPFLMLIPVLLSGGVGTRLWPLSRATRPKQFLPLGDKGSMLQETQRRLRGFDCGPSVVVCNAEHRFLVAEQLREETDQPPSIILEPIGRNTAPAIALAALHVARSNPKASLLVLPADHYLQDTATFQKVVQRAAIYAKQGLLMTFGVVPDRPEIGYGYLRSGAQLNEGIYELSEFVEKPDQKTAENYLSTGSYLWNSGIFLVRADCYLTALSQHQPKILDACNFIEV